MTREVPIDVAALPRLGRAPAQHSAEQGAAAGLNRHPSMEDMSMRTLMWNPPLQDAYAQFSAALRGAARVPAREREIAILRHAWDCGADYQWGMHVESGRAAGLTDAEIESLTQDGGGDWAPHEAALIRAVDELHAVSRVSDAVWAALSAHYSEADLIELFMVVGSYHLLAYIQNTVGIRPPDGTIPYRPGNSFTFSDPA